MAKVEIYKLKKTADPAVREYGMFEFFGMVDGPLPQNYVREWVGELPSGNLDMLCGKFFLNPPDGYHSGPLEKSDIAVVNGEAYFLDRESGYKFVDVDFDTSDIKDAVHVKYGYYVNTDGAATISSNVAEVCGKLDIPIGYFSDPDYHGSHKGESSFDPSARDSYATAYIHPQFLKDTEAREFISLLTELSLAERWQETKEYLTRSYPVYHQDLEKARELFAPELLLPAELRPLSKVIPAGADKSELDILAAKVRYMDGEERRVFDAVIEAGWHCGSVAEIINLTENLGCFEIQPAFDAKQYGAFHVNLARDEYADMMNRLEASADPAEQDFFQYVAGIEAHVDLDAYGKWIAENEGGAFTEQGYLTESGDFKEVYRGPEDISAEHRVSLTPSAVEAKEPLIMVGNTNLSALLLEMHALGGDYMKDAKHNLQTLAGGGTEFIVMMSDHVLTVTPAEILFHRDTIEHEKWMLMDKTADIRTFVMSVTDRRDGLVIGSLCETDLAALRSSLQMNSIKHDDPASEGQLAAYLDVFRWAVEQNRKAVPAGVFLQQINEPYMSRSHVPKPAGFRVSPETARALLAQDAVNIFKAYPEPVARLMPIDAAKASLWTGDKFEYFVKHNESEKLERWAGRAAGELLRQTERCAPEKTKSHGQEL